MRTRNPAVYILASRPNGALYTGVTSNLPTRLAQHQAATTGFTARYNCKTLVYVEPHPDMPTAIAREKQLKAGPRRKKRALIQSQNPTWRDLSPEIT